MSDIGVVRDKMLVEVGEAKEGVNIFYFGRGRPARNPIKFDRIHG